MNFNVIDDFPETYLYNNQNYDSEKGETHEVDIDKIVYELIQCGKDRDRFELIMENLQKEFLGDEKLSDSEDEEYSNRNLNVNKNTGNYMRQMSDFSTISMLHTGRTVEPEYKYNSMSTAKRELKQFQNFEQQKQINHYGGGQNTTNYNNNPPKKYHKQYTDVHANTKYYYPNDFYNNPYENGEIDFEPSQWTDRANRSTLYNQTHNNSFYTTYAAERLFDETENPSPYRLNKDNTNSILLNRQFKK